MTTTPDPAQGPSQPGGTKFFTWLREFGIVRDSDRWFAGVAAGLARKAGIDPLIVRGIFIVLTIIGGPGLLLYAIGWLLLPDTSGRIHVEEIVRGRASGGVITIAVLIAVFLLLPVVTLGAVNSPHVFGLNLWGAFGVPGWLTATMAWIVWIGVIITLGFIARSLVIKRGRAQDSTPGADHPEGSGGPHAGEPGAPGQGTPGPAAAFAAPGGQANPAGPPPYQTQQQAAAPAAETAQQQAAPQAPDTQGDPDWRFAQQTGAQQPGPQQPEQTWTEHMTQQAQAFGERAEQWGQKATKSANEWSAKATQTADEWSVKYAREHEATKLGAAHVVITLALALIAAGAAAFYALSIDMNVWSGDGITTGWHSAAMVSALIAGLVVLSVSIIIAGIRGRRTSGIGFLAFCTAAALLFAAVLPWGARVQIAGNLHSNALSAPALVSIAGNTRVDLRDLDGSSNPNDSLDVWLVAGNIELALPRHRPTVIDVRVLAGRVQSDSGTQQHTLTAGPLVSRTIKVNITDDRVTAATKGVAHVSVYLVAGNVSIASGSAFGANWNDVIGLPSNARTEHTAIPEGAAA